MFKKLVSPFPLLCFVLAAAGVSPAAVNVSSPANGSTVGSPVRFVANATPVTTHRITAMRIYVDNVDSHTSYSDKIDTSLNLAAGTRRVVIVAWDAAGASQTSSLTVNVGASSTSSSVVQVSEPAAGATVGSPTRFVARASGAHPITAMRIYVDHQSVFLVNGSSLDTQVSMAAGTRQVTVQAWDTTGAVHKNSFTVNVGTSTTTFSSTSSAQAFTNIDHMTGWESCDVCAGIDASGPSTPHSMTIGRSDPSLDGSSAEFWMGGTTPYSQALWWRQLGARDSARFFSYELYFYMKNPNAAQALEFDVNQSVDGRKYIFGTECDIRGSGQWRVWDTANKQWLGTGIACRVPEAYKWHHLVWEFERTTDNRVRFIAVTLNGVKSYVNRVYYPQPSSVRELNVAFQMDGNYRNENYSVWLDKVTLHYW